MSLRKTGIHAGMEFSMWLTNPRMFLLLILLVLIHSIVIQPIAAGAKALETSFHILEPVAALSNSYLILLILPVVFLVLFSDFPRMNQGFLLQLYRVGRTNWVLGEFVHLCLSAASYLAATMLGTMLCSLPYLPAFRGDWSAVVTEKESIAAAATLKLITKLLPRNLYLQMSLGTAVVRSYLFLLLYLILIGTVLLAASLLRVRFLGIAINVGVMLGGTGLAVLENDWMWLFPCAHALTWVHYTEYLRKLIFPLWGSALYFLIGVLLFLRIALLAAKNRSFNSILEFD